MVDAVESIALNGQVRLSLQELLPSPPDLALELLPYQREAMTWMVHQEEHSRYRGGLLAD